MKKEKDNLQKGIEIIPEKTAMKPEIKNSILAICFLTFGLILILSFFNLAGPVGKLIFKIFDYLLGWGYFILPLLLMTISFNFFRSWLEKINFNFFTIIGSFLVLFSSLSVLEIFFLEKGGLIGGIGAVLERFLGIWATIIIYLAALISGFVLIFQMPIKLPRISFKPLKEENFKVSIPLEETVREIEEAIITEKEDKKLKDKKGDEEKPVTEEKMLFPALKVKGSYKLPPLDLFEIAGAKPTAGDIRANANIIKRTLEGFGISVEMGEVNIGPTVTQYTLKPIEGVKLSNITALQNDLALALAAHPLRIEAPIPGKSLVGIEVPNKSIALVRLGNLFKEINFQKETSPLSLALGRDVKGDVILTDLTRMPHLLIAGATGTGKSICIHSIISSLLFKNSPENLRLILIDPKRVELARYNGINHLLTSVIIEHKKVLAVLRWVIKEMERRYDLLSLYQARGIESFNYKAINKKEQILPYIVIIIDELADLMIYYGKDLEIFIIRIAQMARATGIHLIVSTQRPSVEVITGLIKANITCRIAFQVASQVDSRTILDMAGAEKLLGYGDMLYLAPESSKPRRIQGAYISEKEIERMVDFIIKTSQETEFNGLATELENFVEDSLPPLERINFEELEEDKDELYPDAYDVVVKAGKASATLLQRRLKVGYVRAARLLDMLEAKGVIGPVDGAKPREVFVKEEE